MSKTGETDDGNQTVDSGNSGRLRPRAGGVQFQFEQQFQLDQQFQLERHHERQLGIYRYEVGAGL
jgi:hypothetical protein